ncbi:MAG: divalent-cation tolerance protein CutA, partial [Azonexus sp.]|nr:divalent-cation tolerance protein CutA [Azonexus sp.]
MEPFFIITNCPDETVANAIALAVVEEKLAACVNLLPRVQSIYRWQGAVESASE